MMAVILPSLLVTVAVVGAAGAVIVAFMLRHSRRDAERWVEEHIETNYPGLQP